jgi:hypothetical protein
MHIELRDHTGKMHRVPAEGAVFGRDPNRCDIVFPDIGVSGVHAKIYCREGSWFLEDLHSSNGTYIADQRVSGPVELAVGLSFSLFRWRFEVLNLGEAVSHEPEAALGSDPSKTAPLLATGAPRPQKGPATAVRAPAGPSAAASSGTAWSKTNAEPKSAPAQRSGTGTAARPRPTAPEDDEDEARVEEAALAAADDSELPVDLGAALAQFQAPRLIAGMKAGLAFYLLAMPKMALRPITFVRESIADPQHPAMSPVDLAAWVFPALVFGVLVSTIAGVVLGLVTHTFSVSQALISAAIDLVIMAIASFVAGLIWHIFLSWSVPLLGGQSDAVSRSNMFVTVGAALPLVAVAGAIGVLVSLAPLPFIGLIGPILTAVAILMILLACYRWYESFKVVRWFLIVLIVLGALSAVTALRDAAAVVQVGVASLRSRTAVASTAGAAPDARVAAATSAESVTGTAAGTSNTTTSTGSATAAPGTIPAVAAQNHPSGTIQPIPVTATPPAAGGAASPSGAATSAAGQPIAVTGGSVVSPSMPAKRLSYAEYVAKRTAVEKMIESDPPLLTRIPGLLDLYRKLHTEMARIDTKYGTKGKKGGSDDVVSERLRDAEVYDSTVGFVAEMERLISERR